ncbi:hypothetical protein BDK51DRAFT_31374 [Blyttiomyces helicus]|uniref:Transcription factor domain-containing protein n=1 Tax=Blyttiomyces helicus TaxID=388810 RepID=A0A4P9W694_9FUNG|nr:hypothetical protein BDK51DRAFT_31374 [Blyttiomyces helicus]|eukprot:RKO87971.1 hypothetical protein BDK51DRAFT_31374 [Blyttiomyces helicus]
MDIAALLNPSSADLAVNTTSQDVLPALPTSQIIDDMIEPRPLVLLYAMVCCAGMAHPAFSGNHGALRAIFYERAKRLLVVDSPNPVVLKTVVHLALFCLRTNDLGSAQIWIAVSMTLGRILWPPINGFPRAMVRTGIEAEEIRRCYWVATVWEAILSSFHHPRLYSIPLLEIAWSHSLPAPDMTFHAMPTVAPAPANRQPTPTLGELLTSPAAASNPHIGPNAHLCGLAVLAERVSRFRAEYDGRALLPFDSLAIYEDFEGMQWAMGQVVARERELAGWYEKLPSNARMFGSDDSRDRPRHDGWAAANVEDSVNCVPVIWLVIWCAEGGECVQGTSPKSRQVTGPRAGLPAGLRNLAEISEIRAPSSHPASAGDRRKTAERGLCPRGINVTFIKPIDILTTPISIVAKPTGLTPHQLDDVLVSWQRSEFFVASVNHAAKGTKIIKEMNAHGRPRVPRGHYILTRATAFLGTINLLAARQIVVLELPPPDETATPPGSGDPPQGRNLLSAPSILRRRAEICAQELALHVPFCQAAKASESLLRLLKLEVEGGDGTYALMLNMRNPDRCYTRGGNGREGK